MAIVAYLVSAVLLAAWLWIILQCLRAALKPRTWRARLAKAGGAMLVLGFLSFLAYAGSRLVPQSIEWPIGLAGDVLTTPSGVRVVAHNASNRVQIYEPDGSFRRALLVDAKGGVMAVSIVEGTHIEVITARGDRRFVFDLDGRQLSNDPAPPGAFSGPSGLSLGPWVPTWPWLWTLTTPAAGMPSAVLGVALLAITGRVKFNARTAARTIPPLHSSRGLSARCPACDSPLPPDDINVSTDTALCRACGHTTSYSVIVHAPVQSIHSAPPEGCDVQESAGVWRAVATMRSLRCIPLGIFAILWNGLLLVFAITFLLSSGAPFLVVLISGHAAAGAFIAWTAACFAFGEVEVKIEAAELSVSAGFRPMRFTRRRKLAEIRGLRQETRPRSPFGQQVLVIDAPKPIRFGGLLSDQRRYFLYAVLASRLRAPSTPTPPNSHISPPQPNS